MSLESEIVEGLHDADLVKLGIAIQLRRAMLSPNPEEFEFSRRQTFMDGRKSVRDFKVGDEVVFNAGARPTYLHGVHATVTKINQTRVKVLLPVEVGARFGGKDVACPLSIIDKVEAPSGS